MPQHLLLEVEQGSHLDVHELNCTLCSKKQAFEDRDQVRWSQRTAPLVLRTGTTSIAIGYQLGDTARRT